MLYRQVDTNIQIGPTSFISTPDVDLLLILSIRGGNNHVNGQIPVKTPRSVRCRSNLVRRCVMGTRRSWND